MCSLETFKVDLREVTDYEKNFSFDLDNSYFKAIGGSEVKGGAVHVDVSIRRIFGIYELLVHCEGTVIVLCDLCLDDMEQPVNSDNRIQAKLGDEYKEEGDIITVERDNGLIDLSWLIYEFVALSVPVRHVHADGQCNVSMTAILKAHGAGAEQEGETDPRWSELKKLKTIIKD